MSLTYGNLVRGTYLVLFSASSLVCLIKPSEHSVIVAALNLIGFIAFDVVCQFKKKDSPDHTKEIAALKEQNAQLERNFQVIRDNISVASASGMIRR